MAEAEGHGQPVKAQLGLWDAVSIIIGIVIGASIYKTPPIIFQNVSSPLEGMGLWVLGGALALVGALCYAELATTYPRSGGDYVYLTRAFHPGVGFLFGWAQLAVILTSSIGAMAFVFAEYATEFLGITEGKAQQETILAASAVIALSVLNILGVVLGKSVQNLLTVVKVVGLGCIFIAGMLWSAPGAWSGDTWAARIDSKDASFGVALILVLYAYGGWNDAAFVAADMRDRRSIPGALLLGVAGITVIYLVVNLAYLLALGFEDARAFGPIAAKVLQKTPLGENGAKAISLLVMISALGAVNGLIFTGSRVYSSLGAEHSVFAVLGKWNKQVNAPVNSLLIQAVIALAMILLVGTKTGRDLIDSAVMTVGLPAMPWQKYFGGFDTLFAGTAPVFWLFFLLTGLSLFVLRVKDAGIERPFVLRVPWFPLLPLIFCGMCIFGLYSALNYAGWVSLIGVIPLVVGIPLFFVSRHRPTVSEAPAPELAARD
jgi:amino acid transporter